MAVFRPGPIMDSHREIVPHPALLQSRVSLRGDVAAIAEGPQHAVVYCEVTDLAPIRAALEGWPRVQERHHLSLARLWRLSPGG